jgi:hypothetical protein
LFFLGALAQKEQAEEGWDEGGFGFHILALL